ncbi:endonuclease domain-containing protein [Pelagerythrobacter sp.]|uniref:endonuclease domain-containing protein n=1 Tax=Pelagerythrobacter sp. TaxID=2800702 RepID=UPI0035AF3EC0
MPRSKQPRNVGLARRLRQSMSLPEVLLWQALRGSPQGIKVRRQHAIGDYVLDFYVASRKLAIEIDGISHDMGDRPARDEARDAWLRERGIEVMRIAADEVLRDADGTADAIIRYCLGG